MHPYVWRCVVEIRSGFNPVSFDWYFSSDYKDCFDYFETRAHLINKKRKVFVKELGTKHRHYHFDERFYAELLAKADVSSDEFYEEKTTDDLASVQLDKRKGFAPIVWRGLRGRTDGRPPIPAKTGDVFHPMKQRTFHEDTD